MTDAEEFDDPKREYERLKGMFANASFSEFRDGAWLADLIRRVLTKHANAVDADYIRRKYPGAGPRQQCDKAIALAAKHASIVGGVTASAVSALELSSLGPQALVSFPAMAACLMAEIGYTSQLQLKVTYDLSVIQGAPLLLDDVEDCYLVLLTALGVKGYEFVGDAGMKLGPKIVAYNARKVLRSGLRKALQAALKKLGGTWLARKLTERAMLRFLVPGINIPIAVGANYLFTRSVLRVGRDAMARRGAVVRPLARLFRRAPDLPKLGPLKVLLATIDSVNRDAWSEDQLHALRHCQAALAITDEDVAELEGWLDRSPEAAVSELPALSRKAVDDLLELVAVVAALFPDGRHDGAYARALAALGGRAPEPPTPRDVEARIATRRKELA